MRRRPPGPTRTDTLLPCSTPCRSLAQIIFVRRNRSRRGAARRQRRCARGARRVVAGANHDGDRAVLATPVGQCGRETEIAALFGRHLVIACDQPFVARCRSELTRSEEHTSELQSLMRISYAVFCLKKKKAQEKNSERTIS